MIPGRVSTHWLPSGALAWSFETPFVIATGFTSWPECRSAIVTLCSRGEADTLIGEYERLVNDLEKRY